MDHFRDDERGQALPVVVLLFAAAVAASLVLGLIGRVVIHRAEARTAADAAALAAAGADRETAVEVARANGGWMPNVYEDGDEFRVTLGRGDVVAAATARRVDPPPIEGTGSRAGLAPAMLAALARADDLLGRAVPITSGYRSVEHQRRLWEQRHLNPYPVAPPGSSRHQTGLAVDVPSAFVPTLLSVADDAGLCRPLPVRDPIHFEVCGGR